MSDAADAVQFRVVVPARMASSRLPGKPLADIAGMPMIVRVMQQAAKADPVEIVAAVDDMRVAEVLSAHQLPWCMTATNHPSGTDRIHEVAMQRGWDADDIVVNVQGDEPLLPPAVIAQVAEGLNANPGFGAFTLCEPLSEDADIDNANIVKVVRSIAGQALYFSRAAIPYAREGRVGTPVQYLRHIGIYAYRVRTLQRFVNLSQSTLETTEMLEQLRLLENGIAIGVQISTEPVPGGVDTPMDLERVNALFGAGT